MRIFALVVALIATFTSLFALTLMWRNDVCRDGMVAWRMQEWRQRDKLPLLFSMTIQDIINESNSFEKSGSKDKGCDFGYFWKLMACSQLDQKELSHILIPRGKTADTEAEMAAIIKQCMDELEQEGFSPTGWLLAYVS